MFGKKSGRRGLPRSKFLTGPASRQRSVCAPTRDDVLILPRTNLEKENFPCHSPIGCETCPLRLTRAQCNTSRARDGGVALQRTSQTGAPQWTAPSCAVFSPAL